MQKLIKPQTLKGFRDYLPSAMLARERLIETARKIYRSYGFCPIDTPALEYTEILLGKGGEETDKQMFRFTDQGERDVSMRFDLTIPLARFAAEHLSEIGTPFRRYHIATVWRAEKPQKGRYREFMQCDFDTIGTESNASDAETMFVIHDLMRAIGFERFTIRVNNRLVLNGLLQKLGLESRTTEVLRALDKLRKIGEDGVRAELAEKAGTTPEQADQVLALVSLTGENATILERLQEMLAGNETGELGVARLTELLAMAAGSGIDTDRIQLDVSIARGLDYYTGTIYETFLDDLPGIGSVCSGGRYDNLAALFTKEKLPGVGASLGLDRLLAAMEELGLLQEAATPADVLVVAFDAAHMADYLRIGRFLRENGIAAEVYTDARQAGKQLKYADRKGFRLALIAGSNEFAAGQWLIKDLRAGTQKGVAESELAAAVKDCLNS